MLMTLPLAIFWVVLLAWRRELGWKRSLIFTGIWAALLVGVEALGLDTYFLIAGEALLDIILLATIYIGSAY